jgi:hypothetical protein
LARKVGNLKLATGYITSTHHEFFKVEKNTTI